MCSEFHKAMRNKASEEVQKATEARSIQQLQHLMQGQKLTEFMENIQEKLDARKNAKKSPQGLTICKMKTQ